MKRLRIIAAVSVTTLLLAVPVAAQNPAVADAARHPRLALARVARNFMMRIRQGVRANQITPEERAQLKSELMAVRSEVRSIRQSGVPPTAEQRAAVRAQLQRISRDIYAARHGELASK
jgi:hypothetical protein